MFADNYTEPCHKKTYFITAISLRAFVGRQRDSTRPNCAAVIEFHPAVSLAAREQKIYRRRRWKLDTDTELSFL